MAQECFLLGLEIVLLQNIGRPVCFISDDNIGRFRSEKVHMKLPRNIEDAKRLGAVLYRYKDNHYYTVLGAIFVTYIL